MKASINPFGKFNEEYPSLTTSPSKNISSIYSFSLRYSVNLTCKKSHSSRSQHSN